MECGTDKQNCYCLEYLYKRLCCPGVERHIQSVVVKEDSPSIQDKNLPNYRKVC
jgi:hypothetical protein